MRKTSKVKMFDAAEIVQGFMVMEDWNSSVIKIVR